MKRKIIVKERFAWWTLNPLIYFLCSVVLFFMGLMIMLSSAVPALNVYVMEKWLRTEKEMAKIKNPLIEKIRYRVVYRREIVKEVLEKIK